MSVKFKVRIYALFQFFSFAATLLIVIGWGVSLIHSVKGPTDNKGWWSDVISSLLTFDKTEISSILGSVLVYIGIVIIVVTWILGWTLFSVRDRNFYDQLFLLFVCIPVISNLFALFAQLSLNTHKFTNSKLNKEEIEIEKTKIIALFNAKKKQLQKELEGKDQFVKLEAELDKTPDIKLVAKSEHVNKDDKQPSVVRKTKIIVEPKEPGVLKKQILEKEEATKIAKAKKEEAKKDAIKKAVAKPATKKAASTNKTSKKK